MLTKNPSIFGATIVSLFLSSPSTVMSAVSSAVIAGNLLIELKNIIIFLNGFRTIYYLPQIESSHEIFARRYKVRMHGWEMNAIAETFLTNLFWQRFNESSGCKFGWWVDCGAGHRMKCWHWWDAHNMTATPLHHARQKCACNLMTSNFYFHSFFYFHWVCSIGMIYAQTYVIIWCDVNIDDSLNFLFAALAQREQRHQSSIID